MSNKKYQTDNNGKLMICAHCDTENQIENADFCIYCGYSLKNQCTNYNQCGAMIPANAAYCPYCGSESHFLRSNLVKSKRQILISDDELPF